MSEQEKILAHLDEVFRDTERRLNGKAGSPLHAFLKESFEALKQVQFPDRKHEDWKYTSVQKLISPRYHLAESVSNITINTIPGLESYIIPVHNGKLQYDDIDPNFWQKGVTILPLHEAFESTFWKEAFSRWIFSTDLSANRAFELLNFAFGTNGFYLNIPDHLVLDKPIELRIIHDDPTLSFSHPLYFIRSGTGSSITMFERFDRNVSLEDSSVHSLINTSGFIHLERNATFKHIKWQDLGMYQNLVYRLHISQLRDSNYQALAFDFGGSLIRNNITTELLESNTYTSLEAGYMAKGQQSMDHQTSILHKVPHGESHEIYKGIIDDRASAAFNGKVYVYPDAQKTNAFQQNDTLVLSPNALMNSKPQLEIFADDVKCSHGATIGQMDQQALFYLKSRGLDNTAAKHILKTAFLAEVLDKVPNESIRHYISSRMSVDI